MYHAIITAGGIGERFWPLSRKERPKQLLKLVSDRSMIQLTVDRLKPLFPMDCIWVVTSNSLFEAILQEIPDLPISNLILEPYNRGTAAAIGLVASHIQKKDPDAIMMIQPADHYIAQEEAFRNLLLAAESYVKSTDSLVTCGFAPTRVGTGFGHIEIGEQLPTDISTDLSKENLSLYEKNNFKIYKVTKFIEKPPYEMAEIFSKSAKHLWNSGIFIWSIATFQNMLSRFMPELYFQLEQHSKLIGTKEEKKSLEYWYARIPSIAIEYGILEKTDNIVVIPGNFRWEDIGTWEGLRNVVDVDDNGNVVQGNVMIRDVQNSTLICEEGCVGAIGVENLVIIKSSDSVFICSRERLDEMRPFLSEMSRHPVFKTQL